MKKFLKNERGSMAVFTISVVLCFVIILLGILTLTNGIRKNQLKTELKIKEVYEQERTETY